MSNKIPRPGKSRQRLLKTVRRVPGTAVPVDNAEGRTRPPTQCPKSVSDRAYILEIKRQASLGHSSILVASGLAPRVLTRILFLLEGEDNTSGVVGLKGYLG